MTPEKKTNDQKDLIAGTPRKISCPGITNRGKEREEKSRGAEKGL